MELNKISETHRRFPHDEVQLAYRSSTEKQRQKDIYPYIKYNYLPSLCLGFRAVRRNFVEKDASSWRDSIGERQVAFRHTGIVKVNIDYCSPETHKLIGQSAWVETHKTNIFGVGLEGETPDSLLLRDVFTISSADSLSSKALLDEIYVQEKSTLVISITLTFNYAAAMKDVFNIFSLPHPERDIKKAVFAAQHIVVPAASPKTIMLPLSLLSPHGTESIPYNIIMELDWRKQRLPGSNLSTISQQQLQSVPDIKPKIRVKYCFVSRDQSHQFDLDSLSCPFCDWREFRTLDTLFFHFRTMHHFLKFSLDNREVKDTIIRAKFSILIKHHPEMEMILMHARSRHSQHQLLMDQPTSDEREEISIYRKAPFLVIEQVRQVIMRSLQKERTAADLQTLQEPKDCRQTDYQDSLSIQSGVGANFNLPHSFDKLKTKRVPRPPEGVTFFHTVTKRPLMDGEQVSESDDEVDQSWLRAKHMQNLADCGGLEPSTINLLQKHDEHVWEERLYGNSFAPDALKRFVRDNRNSLRKKPMKSEFLYKASCMVSSGACDASTVEELIRLIDTNPQEVEILSPLNRKETKSGYLHDSITKYSSTPRRSDSTSPTNPYVVREESLSNAQQNNEKTSDRNTGRSNEIENCKWKLNTCVCGKHAYDVDDIVVCSNAKCRNELFHRTCMGVTDSRTDWFCLNCSVPVVCRP